MPKYVFIAASAAKDGRDDEYNKWYDEEHFDDICALPGVKSGRRFNASPSSPMETPAPYLAIYEIETDDPDQVFTELHSRMQAGKMSATDSLDPTSARLWLYEQR